MFAPVCTFSHHPSAIFISKNSAKTKVVLSFHWDSNLNNILTLTLKPVLKKPFLKCKDFHLYLIVFLIT